ncbi:hypothetical protein [Vibrio parahaemolyticus]|uniref:hypothetical protein n=1 Tax=Vibrio parahaemolyticus TaxID=670 RepID=UPI0004DEF8AA|nr:hypothetical protein [Vibrio parahaemolyticus]
MNIKPTQTNLVISILESANYGPTTVDSMLFWNKETEEAGRIHLEFVVEQLLSFKFLTPTQDQRLMTTRQGEQFLCLAIQRKVA